MNCPHCEQHDYDGYHCGLCGYIDREKMRGYLEELPVLNCDTPVRRKLTQGICEICGAPYKRLQWNQKICGPKCKRTYDRMYRKAHARPKAKSMPEGNMNA